MKKTTLTRFTLPAFTERIDKLGPAMPARWGRLDAHRLLAHLRASVEISLGERQIPDTSNAFTRLAFVRWMVFEILPWPKGRIESPAGFLPAPEGGFLEERNRLKEALGRFVEVAEKNPDRRTLHPAFGPTPLHSWARIHGIHIRHHFHQFGLE